MKVIFVGRSGCQTGFGGLRVGGWGGPYKFFLGKIYETQRSCSQNRFFAGKIYETQQSCYQILKTEQQLLSFSVIHRLKFRFVNI